MEEDIKTQNLNSDNTEKPSSEDDGSWILDLIDLSGLDDCQSICNLKQKKC